MKADDLREAYLSFFETKGHTRYPSDSLVPANDPTLLFTGAGMNQFKEMFLGIGNLPFSRATTSQKCFRTGDLDNVGRTYYHQTFFEMLGNFSFGDYFKREAIEWQWEFLTRVIGLPPDKLWVSVFLDDDDAYAIWRDVIRVPEKRIWRLDAKENFWPANAPEDGPNGPCGPCSEIFYDFGSPGAEGDPEAERYCEIGNIVFTQFNRVGVNQLEPLGRENIDTGMGFERILAVLNGVRSNFETDLFLPLLHAIADIAGDNYRYDHPLGQQYRRIAEHVRAATFLVADGVKPSNEGRGYVARRVIRRAVRDGIALGIDRPFLTDLVPVVVSIMGSAYPETKTAEEAARTFLRAEEEKFRSTYETGMALLERELGALAGSRFPGETAFVLYDSHGFPFELCAEICRERGVEVDREGFERCMQAQRERSREGSTMGGEVFVATAITSIKKSVAPTEFLGYAAEEAESTAAVVIRGEEPVETITASDGETRLIAQATPFYAESGGQIGDTGVIEGPKGRFRVVDTRKLDDYIVHYGRVEQGELHRGDPIRLAVDSERRSAIRRNHTATHLLHAALREVLGTHVTQAGSLVAPDRLRFDFTHPKAVSPDELAAIEEFVNREVLRNREVRTDLMDLDQAREAGAMALFGEKYADQVRVVRVGDQSMELCGGTHVGRSAEIGTSLITQESSVASGVRRIEMVTGGGALALARRQRATLRGLSETLKSSPDDLADRIESIQSELRELRRKQEESQRESGLAALEPLLQGAEERAGVSVVAGSVEGDDAATLRSLGDAVRARLGECVVLLAGRNPETGALAVVATATESAVKAGIRAGDVLKAFTAPLGGKGGGRPQMAQGRAPAPVGGPEELEKAFALARQGILETLASN